MVRVHFRNSYTAFAKECDFFEDGWEAIMQSSYCFFDDNTCLLTETTMIFFVLFSFFCAFFILARGFPKNKMCYTGYV